MKVANLSYQEAKQLYLQKFVKPELVASMMPKNLKPAQKHEDAVLSKAEKLLDSKKGDHRENHRQSRDFREMRADQNRPARDSKEGRTEAHEFNRDSDKELSREPALEHRDISHLIQGSRNIELSRILSNCMIPQTSSQGTLMPKGRGASRNQQVKGALTSVGPKSRDPSQKQKGSMQLIMGELSREVKQNPSGKPAVKLERKNSKTGPIEAQITKNLIQDRSAPQVFKSDDPYEEGNPHQHLASRFGKAGDDSDDGEEVLRGDKQLQKSKIQQKLKKYQEMIKFQRYVAEKCQNKQERKRSAAHITKIQLYINNPVFMINDGGGATTLDPSQGKAQLEKKSESEKRSMTPFQLNLSARSSERQTLEQRAANQTKNVSVEQKYLGQEVISHASFESRHGQKGEGSQEEDHLDEFLARQHSQKVVVSDKKTRDGREQMPLPGTFRSQGKTSLMYSSSGKSSELKIYQDIKEKQKKLRLKLSQLGRKVNQQVDEYNPQPVILTTGRSSAKSARSGNSQGSGSPLSITSYQSNQKSKKEGGSSFCDSQKQTRYGVQIFSKKEAAFGMHPEENFMVTNFKQPPKKQDSGANEMVVYIPHIVKFPQKYSESKKKKSIDANSESSRSSKSSSKNKRRQSGEGSVQGRRPSNLLMHSAADYEDPPAFNFRRGYAPHGVQIRAKKSSLSKIKSQSSIANDKAAHNVNEIRIQTLSHSNSTQSIKKSKTSFSSSKNMTGDLNDTSQKSMKSSLQASYGGGRAVESPQIQVGKRKYITRGNKPGSPERSANYTDIAAVTHEFAVRGSKYEIDQPPPSLSKGGSEIYQDYSLIKNSHQGSSSTHSFASNIYLNNQYNHKDCEKCLDVCNCSNESDDQKKILSGRRLKAPKPKKKDKKKFQKQPGGLMGGSLSPIDTAIRPEPPKLDEGLLFAGPEGSNSLESRNPPDPSKKNYLSLKVLKFDDCLSLGNFKMPGSNQGNRFSKPSMHQQSAETLPPSINNKTPYSNPKGTGSLSPINESSGSFHKLNPLDSGEDTLTVPTVPALPQSKEVFLNQMMQPTILRESQLSSISGQVKSVPSLEVKIGDKIIDKTYIGATSSKQIKKNIQNHIQMLKEVQKKKDFSEERQGRTGGNPSQQPHLIHEESKEKLNRSELNILSRESPGELTNESVVIVNRPRYTPGYTPGTGTISQSGATLPGQPQQNKPMNIAINNLSTLEELQEKFSMLPVELFGSRPKHASPFLDKRRNSDKQNAQQQQSSGLGLVKQPSQYSQKTLPVCLNSKQKPHPKGLPNEATRKVLNKNPPPFRHGLERKPLPPPPEETLKKQTSMHQLQQKQFLLLEKAEASHLREEQKKEEFLKKIRSSSQLATLQKSQGQQPQKFKPIKQPQGKVSVLNSKEPSQLYDQALQSKIRSGHFQGLNSKSLSNLQLPVGNRADRQVPLSKEEEPRTWQELIPQLDRYTLDNRTKPTNESLSVHPQSLHLNLEQQIEHSLMKFSSVADAPGGGRNNEMNINEELQLRSGQRLPSSSHTSSQHQTRLPPKNLQIESTPKTQQPIVYNSQSQRRQKQIYSSLEKQVGKQLAALSPATRPQFQSNHPNTVHRSNNKTASFGGRGSSLGKQKFRNLDLDELIYDQEYQQVARR